MSVLLSHGINNDGLKNVDRFVPKLTNEGVKVIDVPLPERRAWNIRWTLKEDIRLFLDYAKPGSAAIGHSHGGNIVLGAAEEVEFSVIWLFNAAVDHDRDLSRIKGSPEIYNVYSRQDWVVWFSGFLPFKNPFGRAGWMGLKNLPQGHNIETGGNHSAVFKEPDLSDWARILLDSYQGYPHLFHDDVADRMRRGGSNPQGDTPLP